jgi:hypothetical protein
MRKEKAVVNKAAADTAIEAEMRAKALADATNTQYHQIVGPKHRRAETRNESAVEEIPSLVSTKLQELIRYSEAMGDTQWWERVSNTVIKIEVIRKEDMRQGDQMMVMEAEPDRGEIVDAGFFQSSHYLVLLVQTPLNDKGEFLLQYLGGTAKKILMTSILFNLEVMGFVQMQFFWCKLQHHVEKY